jgi:hypothetical protein
MRVSEVLVAGVSALSCACSGTTIGHVARGHPGNGADAGAEAKEIVDAHADVRATRTDGSPHVTTEAAADAGWCAATDVISDGLGVDGYVMVDLSPDLAGTIPGSTATWWDAVRRGILAFVRTRDASGHSFGIQYFPSSVASCQADYATPDVEIAMLPDNTAKIEQSLAAHAPLVDAGRPTGPALAGAIAHFAARATRFARAPVAVLITMGVPTECEPMSVGGLAAMADAAFAGSPRVLTTVIALGASPPDLARVGGGEPEYFHISGGDVEEAVRVALLRVVHPPPPLEACEFDVPLLVDTGYVIDLDRIEVMSNSFIVGLERVPRVGVAADCDRNGRQGWYLNTADAAHTVHLCPRTCADSSGQVHLRFGCFLSQAP